MTLYKGNTKLGAIYHGSTKIGKIYKGSTLLYEDNPIPVDTVIANTQEAGSAQLYPGTYEMKVSGAGGTGKGELGYWAISYASGGSAAVWEGTIRITSVVNIAWTTGTGEAVSVTVSIGGTSVLTAGGGSNVPNASTGGDGGTLTKQSAFDTYKVSETVSSNGTKGQGGTQAWGNWNTPGTPVTASASTMNWGIGESAKDGGRTNGGFYLKRIS